MCLEIAYKLAQISPEWVGIIETRLFRVVQGGGRAEVAGREGVRATVKRRPGGQNKWNHWRGVGLIRLSWVSCRNRPLRENEIYLDRRQASFARPESR